MTEPANPQPPGRAPYGQSGPTSHSGAGVPSNPSAAGAPPHRASAGTAASQPSHGVGGQGQAAGGPSSGARPAASSAASSAPSSRRATAPGSRAASPRSQASRSTAPRRAPRLAALQLKRIDPWTVLKIGLIVSIVMFFVWMIAIGLLYLALGGLDVWEKVNVTYNTLVIAADTGGAQPDLITPGRVFGVAAVVGAINIVLFTALSAVASFVYNAAAGMAGGVEVTLAERE